MNWKALVAILVLAVIIIAIRIYPELGKIPLAIFLIAWLIGFAIVVASLFKSS